MNYIKSNDLTIFQIFKNDPFEKRLFLLNCSTNTMRIYS